MRKSTFIITSLLVFPCVMWSQTREDSLNILQTVHNWEDAWEKRNPELAAKDYDKEADWTNAFGMRRVGRDSIYSLLKYVFSLSFVMAGKTEYEYHDLRFLTPQIALLRSRAMRKGQQLPDGSVEEPRKINHLRVYMKYGDRWLITSHLIGDERTPGQAR